MKGAYNRCRLRRFHLGHLQLCRLDPHEALQLGLRCGIDHPPDAQSRGVSAD